MSPMIWMAMLGLTVCGQAGDAQDTVQVDRKLQIWLGPQDWQRDVDGPILSLRTAGELGATDLFAPTVATDAGRFLPWYSGSQGFAHDLAKERRPDERVFRLGLATSDDGKRFEKHPKGPVLALADRLSVLTPSVLR